MHIMDNFDPYAYGSYEIVADGRLRFHFLTFGTYAEGLGLTMVGSVASETSTDSWEDDFVFRAIPSRSKSASSILIYQQS
jgi:hypothetical protein